MKNRLAVLMMAAAVAATMMVGCGSKADTASTAAASSVAVSSVAASTAAASTAAASTTAAK